MGTFETMYKIISDFKIDKKFWNKIDLTEEDYKNRSKPAPYLKTTIKIGKLLGLKTVVEIGATRYAVTQKCIDYFNTENNAFDSPACCTDGHCGFFFGEENFEVYSVDIDENCKTQIEWSYNNLNRKKPENININVPKDGIDFLLNFDKKIDILLLDAWDVGTPNYADKHLEAFEAAKDKLSDVHLILIDDTDFIRKDQGKDYLLTPFLIENGYTLLFNGRQTLFINTMEKSIINEIKVDNVESNLEKIGYITDHPKVILSMTTIPNRLCEVREGWGLRPNLENLLSLSYDNYEIHLNLPFFSSINNEEYLIPEWLLEIQQNNKKLKIFRCNDYGSITKIVPTLLRITDPNQIIITVDDDLIYMDGFIEYLLFKKQTLIDSALGFAGIGSYDGSCHLCTTLRKDTKVKILEGYKTVLYQRKFFTEDFFSEFVGKSWNDDLVISAHLSKNKIDKYVVSYEKDIDYTPRVESFPCVRSIPNEKSGCSLFREKNVEDNNNFFYKQYID